MAEDEGGFIGRWAQRKQRARKGTADVRERPAEPEPTAEVEAGEVVRVEDLPDIDSLEEASDFTPFLKEGVPDALRRRALRKLWRLNPIFANLDGLNDYDEDFTDAATVVEGLKTIYQVGKGMVTPEEEKTAADTETEAEAAEADQDATEATPDSDETKSAQAEPDEAALAEPRLAATAAPPKPPSPAPEVAEAAAPSSTSGSAVRRRWGGFS